MLILLLLVVNTIFFITCKYKSRNTIPNSKTEKITMVLNKFLLIAPLLALVVFAILFTTALTGKFYERSSHALLALMLWLFATSYYSEILRFSKDKKLLVLNGAGVAISIVLAVILSPLYRYNTMIYGSLHIFSYCAGGLMLVVYYICGIQVRAERNTKLTSSKG